MKIGRLRQRWEERAVADARFHIKADRRDWSDADFLQSGEEDVARFVDPVLPMLHRRDAALDVGCGLGRLTRALADRFGWVHGIDISPEMVGGALSFAPPVPANVRYSVCDGSGSIPLPDGEVDLAFSYLVFQHLPTRALVARYLSEIGRVLRPGGIALVQLNGVRRPLRERVSVGIVGSERVPVVHRKPRFKVDPHSPMGVTFTADDARRLARRAGLLVEDLTGAGTDELWVTLRRPGTARR